MKKALVVFLILAVAGGLFATPTVSASLSTGIGIGFDDTDAKAQVDFIRNRGESRWRVDLGLSTSGEKEGYGTYGASGTVRFDLSGRFNTDGFTQTLNDFRAFWAPNSMIRIEAGQGGSGGFGSMGGWDASNDAFGGNGVKIRINPIAGLSIGASLLSGGVKNVEDMAYAFGVKYTVTDLLAIVANAKFDPSQAESAEKLNFAAGVDFGILSALKTIGFTKLAVDARTANGFGGPKSNLGIGEAINFATGALSLSFGARQLLWMGDAATDPKYIPMRFQVGASYKATDIATVGAEVRYLMGNTVAGNYRNASEMNDVDFKGEKLVGLGISPYVTFNVGPTIQLGYNLQKDMSDGAGSGGAKTMTHLIYATVNVSF